MAIKSIFERFADEFDRSSKREVDFATAYSNAATQRANAQRMFEESMRRNDENQRMWSREGRESEIYQTYQKPMHAYWLSGAGRADEIGIASQPGALAAKTFNSNVLVGSATPENLSRRIEIENNQAQKNVELSRAWNNLAPEIRNLYGSALLYNQAVQGAEAKRYFDPKVQAEREKTSDLIFGYTNRIYGGDVASPLDTSSLNTPNQSFAPYAAPQTTGVGAGRGFVNPPLASTKKENPVAGMAGNSQASAMPNSEQLSAQINMWQQQLSQLIDNANNLKKANQLTPELMAATRQKVDSLRGLIAQNQNLMQVAKASEAQNALRLMIGQNQ